MAASAAARAASPLKLGNVSTDYIWPDPRFPGGYRVTFTGGALDICNPVRRPNGCGGTSIREPALEPNAKSKQTQTEVRRQE